MKEKLYTIPINDAFSEKCECPICAMRKVLENNAVEFTMGPSYMEDDIRMETDKLGFCSRHIKMIAEQDNKLGLALVLKTHMDKIAAEVDKRMKLPVKQGGLFHKEQSNPVTDYLDELSRSCFVCNRINDTFKRYIHTVLVMWKTDNEFKNRYSQCSGFCVQHYADLLKEAQKVLGKKEYDEFCSITGKLFTENLKRVDEDTEWFINKFDYRYKDEPWKNAKDALPRAALKCTSTEID